MFNKVLFTIALISCMSGQVTLSRLCESAEEIMTSWVIRRLYWRLNWMILLVMSVMHAKDTE